MFSVLQLQRTTGLLKLNDVHMAELPPSQVGNRVPTVVMRCFCQKLGSVKEMFASFEGQYVARSLIGFGIVPLGPKALAEGFGRDAVCEVEPATGSSHNNIHIFLISYKLSYINIDCHVFS